MSDIKSLLKELVNLPIIRITIGMELVFHMGKPMEYKHESMKGLHKGSYQLRVMHAPWMLYPSQGKGLISFSGMPHVEDILESSMEELFVGKTITEIDYDEDLIAKFSNNYVLNLLSKYAKGNKAFWKLILPEHMTIQCFGSKFVQGD